MARALLALCVIVIVSGKPAAGATQTAVVIFNPWSSDGLRSGFIVSGRVKGWCWIHSLASERPDAWRCITGGESSIYDPCFRGSLQGSLHKDALACADGPFSKRVTLLTLTKPLTDMKLTGELWGLRLREAPWGLRLVSGDTCVFAQGATDAVDGERLNYACAKTGWILGVPDRSTAVWTARSVQWEEGHPPDDRVARVRIATAVF